MLLLFRLGQDLNCIPFIGRFFGFIIEYIIRVIYASDISCRAKVGGGFMIMHGHDIVIGADVVIGCNCKIFNGVSLGNKDTARSSYGNQPVIGDNVLLSTGSKIFGPIKIGDNVVVGANSVVIKDFPSNTVIGGVPAKIIRNIP